MEIPHEILIIFREGGDEAAVVDAIKQYLLTPSQKEFLSHRFISLEDVLNGRIEDGTPQEVVNMFHDWNTKLGFWAFGSTLYHQKVKYDHN